MAESGGLTFGLQNGHLSCIFCKNASDCHALLPCLHTACPECLREFLEPNSSAKSIFSCPVCEFKIQVPKEGISGFKRLRIPVKTVVETHCTQLSNEVHQEKNDTDSDNNLKPLSDMNRPDKVDVDVSNVNDNGNNGPNGTHQQLKTKLTENTNNNSCADKGKLFDGQLLLEPCSDICCPHILDDTRTCIYCTSCDMIMCDNCRDDAHNDHNCSDLSQTAKQKKEYINELLIRLETKMSLYDDEMEQIDTFCEHLCKTKEQMKAAIQNRADHLCSMLQVRKQTLTDELETFCSSNAQYYETNRRHAKKERAIICDSLDFAKRTVRCDVGSAGDVQLLNVYSEMTSRLLHLIHQAESEIHAVDMFNIRLDALEKGREEVHLEKLFGSLVHGNINCADVERVASFNIDLTWPVSLAITKSQDFVVVGKMGAFEANGQIMFYNRQGRLLHRKELCNRLPYDVVCLQDGTIVMSDTWGQLSTYTADGAVVSTMRDMFKGTGRLAVTSDNEILVTSSEQHCVLKYTKDGELLASLPNEESSGDMVLQEPHYVATNNNGNVIVSDFKQNCIFIFDSTGTLLLRCSEETSAQTQLKSLFALCCDPFNNMLVADFPNDQVYLVSPFGQFLGCLLTKKNVISCPNFVTLDHAGHLFVGQYGGEILVFRYLSCMKHA